MVISTGAIRGNLKAKATHGYTTASYLTHAGGGSVFSRGTHTYTLVAVLGVCVVLLQCA